MAGDPSAGKAAAGGSGPIALRPVTAADDTFLFAVYASTRAEELAPARWTPEQQEIFLKSQFELRRAHYARVFPTTNHSLVLRGGQPAGTFMIDRTAEEIRVVDIAFLPEHRGHGLGGRLLQGLCEEARAAGQPVRLHVHRGDRATHLYTRLGFVPVGGDQLYMKMEWHAPDV